MLGFGTRMGGAFLEHIREVWHEELPPAVIRHFTESRGADLIIAEGLGDDVASTHVTSCSDQPGTRRGRGHSTDHKMIAAR
jgi:hypothetical protein